MERIDIITGKQNAYGADLEISLGFDIGLHQHNDGPVHFHFLIDFGPWFAELRIGRDQTYKDPDHKYTAADLMYDVEQELRERRGAQHGTTEN